LGSAFASNLQRDEQGHAVFDAAIVFFLICGFLLGYLVTRLYLQGALGRADLAAVPDELAGPKRRQGETPQLPINAIPDDASEPQPTT